LSLKVGIVAATPVLSRLIPALLKSLAYLGLGVLEFKYELAMRVKNIARTGWMMRGVPPSESETVAEHSYEVAVLALVLGGRLRSSGFQVDVEKVLKLALLHDIVESITGDIVKAVKERIPNPRAIEVEALKELGMEEYAQLLEELEVGGSAEAYLVEVCDNLATLLQAIRYVNRGYTQVLELAESVRRRLEKLLTSGPLPREALNLLRETVSNLLISGEA
jgi:putative hydrolase of HD superfamily